MAKNQERTHTATRQKKRSKTAFVASILVVVTLVSVFLTMAIVTDNSGDTNVTGTALATVADPNYTFSQAEIECLNKAKKTFRYPNALFIDDRSTQDRGKGKFRVFIKVDPSIAMGLESIIVCQAEVIDGYIKVSRTKEIQSGEAGDEGIKVLLDALKMED